MANLLQSSVEAGSAADRVDVEAQEVGAAALAIATSFAKDEKPSPEQLVIGMEVAARLKRTQEEDLRLTLAPAINSQQCRQ
ncbi:hypothetical protein HY605_01495 [Candidatus Peregrinibacteria bacterium]|nr:hypothetical protein [Candidatus Peregrinibacteria bacterium]